MFITKKHLSRRTLLRGAGSALALPLLDAMIPAGTALAQTAAAPKPKLGFFYFPHGAIMDKWTPAATGGGFDVTPILKPLAAFKDQMTIVSNLRNSAAEGAGVHATSPGTWLSCASPFTVMPTIRTMASRPTRSLPSISALIRHSPRWSCVPKSKPLLLPASAVPTSAVASAPPFPSAPAHNHCRWNTTRANCSSACSAKAIPHKNATRS